MKVKVVGSSGAELPGHNSPAFLLGRDILFDAGSLTGILSEKAQLQIKNIFITHAHLDHIKSIPFLADNIIIRGVNHRVNILSIPPVIRTIKLHLFNSAMWPDFTVIPHPDDGILRLCRLKPNRSLKIDDYCITPFMVNHTVPTVGYLVEDNKDKRLFYSGDTGPTAETWSSIGRKLINCLIIDVSFPNAMEQLAIRTGHLTPQLLKAELSNFFHMPERICITHPKPQHLKTITKELKKLQLTNLMIVKDGDTIRI